MAAEGKAVGQAADELYGLPLSEFTRARDERAKELRKKGDREAADAVKALRKPTVAAWALNQLTRTRGKELDRLLAAGKELQAAQEELLAGGGRPAFQRAAAKERELVAELAGEAEPGLAEKIAATLHAAALDPEVADELRAGRLVREREAIGGFGEAAAATPSAPARRGRRAPAETARPARQKPRRKAGAKDAGRGQRKAGKDAERRQRVAAARTDERHAQRELDAAAKALEHARTRADAAQAHAAEANERAKTTADRLNETRRAETAARKAHERAARALERAERGSSRTS